MPSKFVAPRGTQDLLPQQSRAWQRLESRIRSLAGRYGYGEIRTPIFETTDLFVRGVGESTDIVEKEMYTFSDKGGRSITLRPEFTAPVMRAALQHNLLNEGAQRLYYLGPIFRYERPQAGRLRQSHQFGVECTGFTAPQADAEVIALAWDLFEEYSMRGVTLRLNTIGDETCRPAYREALREYFLPHREALSDDSVRRLERNPLRILDSKAAEDQQFLAGAPHFEDFLCAECREHFEQVQQTLRAIGVPFTIDPHIVRGLDYYTRTVFEFVSDALAAQNTVCAGGRYDELVHSLGGPNVPAVGFALGIERFLMAAETAGAELEPPREGVQAITLGPQELARMLPLIAQLRRAGHAVFIDYGKRNVLAQLKIADRNNARFALILGSQELASNELTLRDLVSRTERRIPFEKDIVMGRMEGKT